MSYVEIVHGPFYLINFKADYLPQMASVHNISICDIYITAIDDDLLKYPHMTLLGTFTVWDQEEQIVKV